MASSSSSYLGSTPPPPPPPSSYPGAPPPLTGKPAAETQIAGQCGSGINVANFVSSKLRRDENWNYMSWKQQMLCLLESQGLVGYIDGKTPPPPGDDAEYSAWRRTDWLVKGWILGALSDEAFQNVVHLDSARDVWLDLEKAFSTDQSQSQQETQLAAIININVANFVSTKLSGHSDWSSYNLWKEGMVHLVQSQGLLELLDSSAPPPSNDSNGLSWKQTDGVVKGWILEALSAELVQYVAHLDSAEDVWQELEAQFSSSKLSGQQEKEWHEELELYRAAISGDWDAAKMILKRNPDAIVKRVAFTKETALQVAVGSGNKSVRFVEELVKISDDATLYITDVLGFNPLHTAAWTGNHRAAEILIKRLPDLLYMQSEDIHAFPIHLAACNCHRETVELLMFHTRDDLPINPFAGQSGLLLLHYMISAGFLDMALDLVNRYPYLARMNSSRLRSALYGIAVKDTSFAGHAQLNFWERLLHSCIQLEVKYSHQVQSFHTDHESQNLNQPRRWRKQIRKLHSTLWKFITELVPCVKRIRKKKWVREQGLRLAESICKHMESLGYERAEAIYRHVMINAALSGNHEIIEVIVGTFPNAIFSVQRPTNRSFIHVAVRNRSEKVFNLLYQTTNHRYNYVNSLDSQGNSMLHMAAFLAPPHKLNLVSGAALQMQRELQWFKEVEKFVSPYTKERRNHAKQTPAMLFTEQHKNLKVEGEKWMKDTANSCTIAAALIVTVVFAAAITVPGGNESETGYPMLWENSAFTIFAVSDAISLFTSTTSLLMFLSILTSRYAEEDFLYALPKRLSIGLVTLFLSILFMMAAFSSTVFLVFGRKSAWVLIPAAALTCLPISSFVLLQFPLLIAVISSTYGKGIFGKQSNRPFP